MRPTTYILLACAAALIAAGAHAGDLAPTGAPTSTMSSVEDVYTTVDSISSRLVPSPLLTIRAAEGVTSLPRIDESIKHPYGVAWSPRLRFVDNGDGTSTDRITGLVWLKDMQCGNQWSTVTWSDAMANAAALQDGQCGLTDGSQPGDWRLPNKNEMGTLIKNNQRVPLPISGGCETCWYWTSSTYAPNTDHAWLFSGVSGELTVLLDPPYSTKVPVNGVVNDFHNYGWAVRDADSEYFKPVFIP